MTSPLILLSIPGLRADDVAKMPVLAGWAASGSSGRIAHSFPCVTWPSQCNLLTGTTAREHGVVANGFFWRERGAVEMWTAGNQVIERPQLWDEIRRLRPELKTASWFPMLAKGCGADVVCMPAPIHKPDGSEEMWCYTRPQEFYGELLGELGHFPLHHFWGPLAGIQSSRWIAESAARAAQVFQPGFWYIYLPHLDYAAQKFGPNSPQAMKSLDELNEVLRLLVDKMNETYSQPPVWLVASEYVITPVSHVVYPNRVLREAGLLTVQRQDDGSELIDFQNSRAWALVDHQFSHVFVKDRSAAVIEQVKELFDDCRGIESAVAGDERQYFNLEHPRSGDVVLISEPDSWQAYYWWHDDRAAPAWARTVDIHRKPGYDPIELFFDPATKSIPLDATMVRGSHGAPAVSASMQGALLCSLPAAFDGHDTVADTQIRDLVLKLAGLA